MDKLDQMIETPESTIKFQISRSHVTTMEEYKNTIEL
jgi:hypothetical protein